MNHDSTKIHSLNVIKTFFEHSIRKNIVLINQNWIIKTSSLDLKSSKNMFSGNTFKENELTHIVHFYKIILYKTDFQFSLVKNYINDGWGEVITKGDYEISKYFERENMLDKYFEFMHIPQLVELRI